jgi:site-specific DNA recombinase
MQLKRRGVELRLIVGDHNRSAATVDLPLLKAVARAHRWFDELSTGKAGSLARSLHARRSPCAMWAA